MKNSKNLLIRYLSIFLIFGSINIIAQDNDEAIEEVVVTGSYIKGSPTDGASPGLKTLYISVIASFLLSFLSLKRVDNK